MLWNIDPILIQFDFLASPITNGPLQIRFYGLFFAIGLLLAAWAFPVYLERWGYPRQHGEKLTLWTPIGMIVGAHLIHLLFYETEAFWENPIRIIQIGSGLASHGGGLGAIIAIILFSWKYKTDALAYMDPCMCGATFVIPWVRVGNFFNSEIVGRPWDGPWAVAFARHFAVVDGRGQYDCPGFPGNVVLEDCITRHPSQAYEAILGFIMCAFAIYLMAKWRNKLRPGAVLFILLGYYFTTRFFIEYTKEYQTLSDSFPLTMGQCLSLPIVLLCAYMLLFSKKSNILKPLGPGEIPERTPAEADDDEKKAPRKKVRRKKKKRKRG